MSPEAAFSRHVAATTFDRLGPRAGDAAKAALVDSVAAMLAGASAPGFGRIASLLENWGGARQAAVFGTTLRCPSPNAAWANAVAARRVELDDVTDFAPFHPSASAVAACLSLCEGRAVDGRTFLTAVALAQDINIRFARSLARHAMQTGRYNVFRVFGIAAGAGKLLGLSEDGIRHAMGIAYAFACGEAQSLLEGTDSLALQDGEVSRNAVLAALLAASGHIGPRDFLSGRYGYFAAFDALGDPEELTRGLGETYRGEEISCKPFAACRAAHPAIEAALAFRGQPGFAPAKLDYLVVEASPTIAGLVFPAPTDGSGTAAKNIQFSLPDLVALALAEGPDAVVLTSPAMTLAPETRALAAKVTCVTVEPAGADGFLGLTRFRAKLADKPEWSVEIREALGSPARPLAREDMLAKLHACTAALPRPPGEAQLRGLLDAAQELDRAPSIAGFLEHLRGWGTSDD